MAHGYSYRTGRVEIKVTPGWWGRFGGGGPKEVRRPGTGVRMGRAMELAISAFPVAEVRASRTELRLLLCVPSDVTAEAIDAKAAELLEQLNALPPPAPQNADPNPPREQTPEERDGKARAAAALRESSP